MRKIFFYFLGMTIIQSAFSQKLKVENNPPGLGTIKLESIKKDMYEMAAPHFRGRSAGTLDELKAGEWLADQYRLIGLKPGGDNGTYMQYFTMWRNRVANSSKITINNKNLTLWSDVLVAQMAGKNINAPIVYLGNALDINLATVDVKGKVVAIEANPKGINLEVSLPTWRYNRYILNKYGAKLIEKGAEAIVFIADEYGEKSWADAADNFKLGSFDIVGGPAENITATVPVLWVHGNLKNELQQSTAQLNANIITEKFDYPSVNVIGTLSGTDKELSKEYLLYSGHIDAHGIRNEMKGDSIYYGADDNGSVNVAMLSIAGAFKKYPSKRSVIFVIHGAEERGLLGSRYYVNHPTVPLKNIVTVLNGDMIGRNNPDSAALLGVQAPHRTSVGLVDMAMAANNEGPKFKLDTLWDKPSHIEGWYFRSDHLPYARVGIPSLMYTTLLHPDYHTPQDNAQNIDYPKLKRMTEWMYRTGWKVANAAARPGLDAGFKLER